MSSYNCDLPTYGENTIVAISRGAATDMGKAAVVQDRIQTHPVLKFDRGREVTFYFEGKPVKAYENETVASALYANGLRVFSRSIKYHRPRGFFCAIGRCSSCLMTVDGVPNVRTCVLEAKEGLRVERQNALPNADRDIFSFADRLSFISLAKGFYYRRLIRPVFMRNFYMNILSRFAGLGRLPLKDLTHETSAPREVEMDVEVAVIGGGPAGLSAAIEAGRLCSSVVILDDKSMLGGQLVKQTHRFFGDAKHYAGVRGIRIAAELQQKINELTSVKPLTATRMFGLYDGNTIGAVQGSNLVKIVAKKIIIATGAYERTLIFENNDLPGVYGAGGVQTLMNTYGVIPGSEGLVVGSGNVGLILAYQLLQSGVGVKAILEALPRIGGYYVHAAKVRRLGVEILTRHSVVRAVGKKRVEAAVVARLDEKWNPIAGSERVIDCDFICIAVGLSPTYELVQQAGAELRFIPDLGGFVPVRTRNMQVTDDVYVAGDLAGIEEATTAMLEGKIAGLHASLALGYGGPQHHATIDELLAELDSERAGPLGERIRRGLTKAIKPEAA